MAHKPTKKSFWFDTRVKVACTTLVASVSVLAGTSVAKAGTPGGQFAVEEAGRVKCAVFSKAVAAKSPAYGRYVGFIEGYLTAANRYEPNTFDLSPWHNSQAFALILEQHCRSHADDTLVAAAQKLVVAMAPIRLAAFSKLIEVGDSKRKIVLYETIMKRAQNALRGKGLYRGEVDGKYTPSVRAALVEFQKTAKLDLSGIPDTATLWVLLNP